MEKRYKEYQHHFPAVLKGAETEGGNFRIKALDNFGESINLCLSAFQSGIIRVRIARGEFTPVKYPVVRREFLQEASVKTKETEEMYCITTEEYRIEIKKSPFSFRICHADGRIACRESQNDVDSVGDGYNQIPPAGYSMDGDELKGMNLGFLLHYDESIYGLGEHFTQFDKRGQTVSMRNFDTLGCRDETAYKNIPFYMSSYGYGLFVHHHGIFDFHIGSESAATLSAHIPDSSLEYYLIVRPSPKEILSAFVNLTGPAVLPPKWSFGLWYSTGFKGNSEKNVEEDAKRFRLEKIPCDVMHFDCYWLREDKWCDFVWDEAQYPNRSAMIAGLKENGYKISLWINPYVTITTEMYQEGKEKGYFAKNKEGEPYEADLWHGLLSPCVLLDFTNKDASAWFKAKLKTVLKEGVDVLKTDFGEDIPYDALFSNGMTGKELRNVYSRLYNQAVFEVSQECKGAGNALVWARSGCAGMQQFPVCWSGDPHSSYEGMAATLRAGLSMAMSGVLFWSHDMGGFYGDVTKEIFIRWSQFGLFTSHSRLHGTTTRQPWAYDEETTDILRQFISLRYRLMPYIWKTASECAGSGLPFIRPMVLEYPEDRNVRGMYDQYFFGKDILAAPVFGGRDAVRQVYLPEGAWVEMLGDKRTYTGGKWYSFTCPLDYMPVFARKEAVIETEAVKMYVEDERCYCSHPTGVHSNGICPFKVAYGEGQMPRDHHFSGSDAVQRGARHGLNSNRKMTSKERMLCAIEGGIPDRLPVTVHQWQPYHLKTYMNGMSDIEANKACGLDASINVFSVSGEESDTWKVSSTREQREGFYVKHYTIETPDGILTTSEGISPMTSWVMEHLIKKEEDIHLLRKYRPVPKLDRKLAVQTYDALGEDGILRTFIWGKQGGCWQDACELYGVENLILMTYDDP